ncbi:MAG TPA: low affinity iron permease family protein [Gemmatimonadaceae bacterium]|nr:low affinity iron permease family protein [Gemmatimonadaceae bacterium]
MPDQVRSWFSRFARGTSKAAGRPLAFSIAFIIIVVWAAMGPTFGYSNTWQLVINTGTTIVTFLMVFLIQHSQNRDAETFQVQIAELIRAVEGARNSMVNLDELDDKALERLHKQYAALAEQARSRVGNREKEKKIEAEAETELQA